MEQRLPYTKAPLGAAAGLEHKAIIKRPIHAKEVLTRTHAGIINITTQEIERTGNN